MKIWKSEQLLGPSGVNPKGNYFNRKLLPENLGPSRLPENPGPSRVQDIPGPSRPLTDAAVDSFGKLSLFDWKCTPEEAGSQGAIQDEFLLVHATCWKELMKNLLCEECGHKSLVVQIREQKGFCAKLVIKCEECGCVMGESYTSPRTTGTTEKTAPFEVNKRMVDDMNSLGLGFAAMERLCTLISIKSMSNATYYKHLNNLAEGTKDLERKVLKKAREAVRDAQEAIDPSLRNAEVLDIGVSYDGTWQKRGFTSLYGVGIVIDIVTGLAIDYEVLSKYCHMCVVTAAQLDASSPEFCIWQNGHRAAGECGMNYEGSSGAMGMKAAERLWERSVAKNQMRYITVLSDGDAKTHLYLKNKAPYGDVVSIEKEECVNHIAKRMGTGLRKLVKEWKVKGVTLGGRGVGTLKEGTITSLTSYYRNAIVKKIPDVPAMKKAIRATIAHCSSTDEHPQHADCPTGPTSWCFFTRSVTERKQPESHDKMSLKLNATVVEKLQPLYERLSSDELLALAAHEVQHRM